MASKPQLIRLEPEEISFNMMEKEPTVLLNVYNTSEKMIAFKVKTTHPKRYLVRPNQAVVRLGEHATVKICLQIKDAKPLRQEMIMGVSNLSEDCKDNKFLVQCAPVKDAYLDSIEPLHENNNAKEVGNVLKTMWQEMTRDEFVNKKLMCVFQYPKDVEELREVDSLGDATLPSLSDDNFEPEINADTSDIADLRKKYNELINFTVQLTAERDRFKASYKTATKELQLAKKGQSLPSERMSGVRKDSTETDLASGWAMWQIMLVTMIAFFMGRIFTQFQ